MNLEHATPGVLAIMLLSIFPVIWHVNRFKKTNNADSAFIRKIPGVMAIEEAVGHAAESGRPISFCTGLTGVGPVLYACLGVLFYVARRAARLKSPLFIPQNSPNAMAIVESVVRNAYRIEGRLNYFDPQTIRFLSEEQFAFASGYIGLIHRENVGTAFLFGSFAAESLVLAEAGQQVGAMQVAASVSPEQVAFFICTCDYTLIGEELFAASAYLGRDPIQIGSLYGQDRAKLLFLILIIWGVFQATITSLFPNYTLPFDLIKLITGGW